MRKTVNFLNLLRSVNRLAVQDLRTKKFIGWIAVLTVLIAFFPTGSSFALAQLMNRLQIMTQTHQTQAIGGMTLLYLLFIILVPYVLRAIKIRLVGKTTDYLKQYFRIALRRKMADLEYAYFDNSEFHDLVKNVNEKGVDATFGMFLIQFEIVDSIIGMILAVAAISFLGLKYIVVIIIASLPMLAIEVWKKKKTKQIFDQNRSDYRYADVYFDAAGDRETRVFGLNSKYINSYKLKTDAILERFITYADSRAVITFIGFFLVCLGAAYVVYNAFLSIVAGIILIGSGYFILTSLWTFVNSLQAMISIVTSLYENAMYGQEFFELMNLPAVIKEPAKPIIVSKNTAPSIVFENVSFSYPGKEKPALTNTTFQITAGSKCSLVGENGGGKSTIIKLLLRFYDPTEGRILVDGQDLRELDLATWRNIIGYVAQSPSVPNLKLRETLSHEIELSDDILHMATQRSRAHDFIKKYKHGYDQQLGKMFKDGISPSDGQRQRIAISRAYSKEPKLLILDEPTADLDPDTQHHVFNDFYHNNPNVTGILVAHALQGVISANTIFVFENGALTQTGNHEKLVSIPGWYQTSFEKQSKPFQSFVH